MNGKGWRQTIRPAAAVVLLLSLCAAASAKYSGGTGEPNDPYRIATPNDLNDIGNHVEDFNKCFVMVNDVNLAEYIGHYRFNVIGMWDEPFKGVFDGNGHVILNFTYNEPEADYPVALFSYAGDPNCEIKHLTLSEPNLVGGTRVAALVGKFYDGRISNCHVLSGKILGANLVAGLIGSCESGTIVNSTSYADVNGGSDFAGGLVAVADVNISGCFASGSVSAYICVGGLIGGSHSSTVSDSHASGSVSGYKMVGGLVGSTGAGFRLLRSYYEGEVLGHDRDIGGLVGANEGSLISCYATGSVSGTVNYVGGLCGSNDEGGISDCYARGDVSGDTVVGGLCGTNYSGTVSNCYAVGRVDANSIVGGLVGDDDGGSYTKSFWDTDVNPDVNGIGNANDVNVIGKTTAEMMTESTFTDAGWDFVGETANGSDDIWRMCVDGVRYPLLSWQFTAGDLLCPDGVDFADYSHLANRWQEVNCAALNDCDRADLDLSGAIDWRDLKIFCDHWLDAVTY
jgi:hypothetical protein